MLTPLQLICHLAIQ